MPHPPQQCPCSPSPAMPVLTHHGAMVTNFFEGLFGVGEKYGLPRPLYGGVYTAALRKIIRALSRCNATECRWYIQRSSSDCRLPDCIHLHHLHEICGQSQRGAPALHIVSPKLCSLCITEVVVLFTP